MPRVRVEEPKQLGEIVIEIAGKKLQITECGNGVLLCSEDGMKKHKIGYEMLNQKLKETLEQKKPLAVPVKKVSKFSKYQERLGEINTNTAGETMKIVKYNNCEDMTVQFEDGTEKVGVRYDKFRQGYVQKPESCDDGNFKKKPHHTARKSEKRLGEVRKNNVGETMEIVKYNNCKDMTVRFEDGTEREGVQYTQSKKGNLRKPKREPVVNREFLQRAEAYLASAKALLEGNESPLVPSVVLCKKAVLNFLKSALESRTEGKTSEGETEDIRFLGREVKEKTGVFFDPRDLAWLNDFDFKQRERWLQPTTEDVIMAIEMVEKIGREVNKVVPKT